MTPLEQQLEPILRDFHGPWARKPEKQLDLTRYASLSTKEIQRQLRAAVAAIEGKIIVLEGNV